ncbi:unnamed protein product, partial [Mesorhabditis belari]|uniref:Protein kinase domain-containing protein n=1 Tax=Mesorhabditis belari TaxID=2138241 RepID=A0AAF3FNA9_9BILA
MGTLRKLIFNSTILYSMKNVTIWSENLFDALDYMFKTKQIIHRDIKTENIFVTKDFIVKLGDFGTTREIDQTCTGTFDVGTIRYRNPPQP